MIPFGETCLPAGTDQGGKSDEKLNGVDKWQDKWFLTMVFARVLLSLHWIQPFVCVYKCLQAFTNGYWCKIGFVLIIN